MTEFILLGFLMSKDLTGYDMKQYMSISTSYFVDASYGSIYPSLKKLEQKGLIHSQEMITNRKLKKVYSITEKGTEAFTKWLSAPIEASKSSISTALAKIFFFRYLSFETAIALIRQYIQDTEQYKNGLLKLKEMIGEKTDEYELTTLNFGLDYYDFIISWYENYLKKISK